MNLEDCYNFLGGDYHDVMRRFQSEERVKRFLVMFLEDQNFQLLCSAWDGENYKDTFSSAHTIKGICLNLSLVDLLHPCVALTENLRSENPNETTNEYVNDLKQKYKKTTATIRTYLNQTPYSQSGDESNGRKV